MALLPSKDFFQNITESYFDGIVVLDKELKIIFCSEQYSALLGFADEDLLNLFWLDFIHQDDKEYVRRSIEYLLTKNDHVSNLEYKVQINNAEWKIFSCDAKNLINNPYIGGVVLYLKDITTLKDNHSVFQTLSYQDHLTGVVNSSVFYDRLNQSILHCSRNNYELAVLALETDIKEDLHENLYNELFRTLTESLRGTLRSNDTIARVSHNKFLIIITDLTKEINIVTVANKILDSVGGIFDIRERQIEVCPSLGISIYPTDSNIPEKLVLYAQMAMDIARIQGGKRYYTYNEELGLLQKELTIQKKR